MPILPKQRDIFPGDLLDDPAIASGPGGRWLALYTLSRREKDLMRRLEAADVPFYAPMIRRRLKSAGGRTRCSFVPLFPG
ncbi:MAG: transcription termination/antitermination NusG family protein [Planctomycetaceae bacterium]